MSNLPDGSPSTNALPAECQTTAVTPEQIKALADAMSQLLHDMGHDGQSVCLYAKAKARIAYEPFVAMMDDEPEFYLSLDEASRIVKETNDAR